MFAPFGLDCVFAKVAIKPGKPVWLARAGGMVDLALGLALLRDLWPQRIALAQLAVVGGYTAGLSLLAPALWADPYGGLMKNLPILVLLLVHLVLVEER